MQILHPFAGSMPEYLTQLDNPDRYRPHQCPQCQAKQPLMAHGFYTRTLLDSAFDGWLRVRRYLCAVCRRTVSLLPEMLWQATMTVQACLQYLDSNQEQELALKHLQLAKDSASASPLRSSPEH